MKRKILFGFLLGMLPFSAQALPVCQPSSVFAKYISRWQQNETETAWQAEFICDDRRQAKLHAEDVEDPASDEGTFFIVDMQNLLESQESFAEPCEAVSQYCSGKMTVLSAEQKAMLAEQMKAAPVEEPEEQEEKAAVPEPAVEEDEREREKYDRGWKEKLPTSPPAAVD